MGRRRTFTREFKESAVELYHSSGRTAKDIAAELGIVRELTRKNACKNALMESQTYMLGDICTAGCAKPLWLI